MRSISARPFFKIYVALGAFFFILFSSTIGYIVIEGYNFLDALYMTVITLATVGYHEVQPLSRAGQVFTIVVILVNIGAFTYFLTQISSYFLDGEFQRTYKLYKMKNAIAELKGHTIICGFGRNGREAAKLLFERGQPFVVIEHTPFRPEYVSFEVKYYLQDNATRDEALQQAGIERAGALLSTLPDDADNLFVVLTAREMNKEMKIISRASQDTSVRKLKTAGANNVIMPDKIGGAHMASLVISPDVKEFIDLMTVQTTDQFSIKELEVNRTISLGELDAWSKTGATVLGVKTSHSDFALNPQSATIIRPGNKMVAMGSKQQLDKLSALLIG
ncbi:MAG: NAD-binding protein [Chitinophagales bacterium]